MKLEQVSFKFKDKIIGGFLYLPKGEGPFPAVVLVHGFGGGIHEFKNKFQCEQLAKNGFIAFMFDFYDTPNKMSTIEIEFTSVSLQLKILRGVIDYVTGMPLVDQSKIGITGHSLGGMTALLYAVSDSRIKALVLQSPVSDFKNTSAFKADHAEWKRKGYHLFAKSFGEMKINWGFIEDAIQYDVYSFAQKVKCPTLVLHGDKDVRVLLGDSQKLIRHLKVSDQLRVIKGAGHTYKERESLQEVTGALLGFMNLHLK